MIDLKIAFSDFIKDKTSYCSIRTVEFYNDNVLKFIDWYSSNHSDQELTNNLYRDYIIYLKSLGVKNETVRTYARAVKVFATFLEDNYGIKNFARKVKMPKSDKELIIPLSVNEVDQVDSQFICNEIGVRNYIIFHLMVDCGLRLSEVVNLNKNDVDFENKNIHINISKGCKSRIVPISEWFCNIMKDYLKSYKHNCKSLLVNEDGLPITVYTIKNLFRRLKQTTGIDRLHAHLCRHTFATSYIMGGGNLEYLRILLGHSDYDVTKNYLHISSTNQIINYPIYKLDKCMFRNYNMKGE